MNWPEAVEAMRAGHAVRRKSESLVKVRDDDIRETGQEGSRLMHAWTADEKPALVFMGSSSKCLFVPDDEDRGATDWVIETNRASGA